LWGKNFPLFRCRHTRKQVLTGQWEKRSICTFEEAVSRRETTSRPIPRLDSASNCYLNWLWCLSLTDLIRTSIFLASNMHVLVRWYQPGGVWKSKLIKKGERSQPAQRRGSPRHPSSGTCLLRGVDTSGVEFIELTKTLKH